MLGLSAVAPPDPPTATMVVAARDIAAGVRLSSDDLATVSVPVHVVPQRSLTETAALGRILAGPLSTGEPLTATRLAGSTLLTGDPDAVALPVRVADPGATLLLSGGDRIDLLAVSPDGESTSAEVVASNLAVLLTPGSSAASAGGDGPSTNTLLSSTASADLLGGLVVVAASHAQARAIVAGAARAPLWLALRAAPPSS